MASMHAIRNEIDRMCVGPRAFRKALAGGSRQEYEARTALRGGFKLPTTEVAAVGEKLKKQKQLLEKITRDLRTGNKASEADAEALDALDKDIDSNPTLTTYSLNPEATKKAAATIAGIVRKQKDSSPEASETGIWRRVLAALKSGWRKLWALTKTVLKWTAVIGLVFWAVCAFLSMTGLGSMALCGVWGSIYTTVAEYQKTRAFCQFQSMMFVPAKMAVQKYGNRVVQKGGAILFGSANAVCSIVKVMGFANLASGGKDMQGEDIGATFNNESTSGTYTTACGAGTGAFMGMLSMMSDGQSMLSSVRAMNAALEPMPPLPPKPTPEQKRLDTLKTIAMQIAGYERAYGAKFAARYVQYEEQVRGTNLHHLFDPRGKSEEGWDEGERVPTPDVGALLTRAGAR